MPRRLFISNDFPPFTIFAKLQICFSDIEICKPDTAFDTFLEVQEDGKDCNAITTESGICDTIIWVPDSRLDTQMSIFRSCQMFGIMGFSAPSQELAVQRFPIHSSLRCTVLVVGPSNCHIRSSVTMPPSTSTPSYVHRPSSSEHLSWLVFL